MAQEIIIDINVNSAQASAKLKETSIDAKGASSSVKLLGEEQKRLAVSSEIAKQKQAALNKEIKALAYETQNAGKIAATYSHSIGEAGKSFSMLDYGGKQATATQKQFRTQAGLNNAILLETGRLASDASYGFTAIANNLSQLVSLGGSFVATTGSVGSAFGELKKSLFGVGGLLLGFQILIGLFQDKRVLDFIKSIGGLNGNLKTLSDLTKDASKNAESLVGNFKMYTAILNDANESEEQRSLALKKLNEEYPDFNSNILTEIDNTKEATRVQNLYIDSLRRRALSQAAENKFKEISGKIVEIELQKEIDKTKERNDFLDKSNRAIVKQELTNGQTIMVSQEEKSQAYVDAVDEIDKAANKEIKNEQDKLDFLIKLIDLGEEKKKKGTKDGSEFQVKIFEGKYKDFERLEQQYREKSQKSELMTNEEILAQTQQNEMAKIDIIEATFVRKEQLRLADYKAQLAQDVKTGNITQEEADVLSAQADQTYLKTLEDLGERRKRLEAQVLNFISSLRTIQTRKDANRAEADYDRMMEIQRKFRLDSADILKLGFGDEEDYYNARQDALSKDIERQRSIVDDAIEGTVERAQAEVELFNLEDKLRQNSLDKERAAVNEKQRINTSYVDYVMGISSVLSKLAGENEELQKAALIVEKGAAIGKIVIDAQASIARGRAETGVANLAALKLPVPFSSIKIAKNEAMFAKETAMTKVGAALGIANILATSISSFRNPSSGTSGGGTAPTVQVQAPDFNVVGTSEIGQLAGGIGAAIGDKPIKAYVSGKDILNSMEEYERNINNSSTG